MKKRHNILIFAGGLSEEREVSLTSAKAVAESLIRQDNKIAVIDIATGQSLLDVKGRYILEPDLNSLSRLDMKKSESVILAETMGSEEYKKCDLVFLALHGGAGENGIIQGMLDLAGVKYTGSGRLASAIAMNKAVTKRLIQSEGILTPKWVMVNLKNINRLEDFAEEIKGQLDFPMVVKPNDSGSTIGLTLVKKESDLTAAINKAGRISDEVLIEEYILSLIHI